MIVDVPGSKAASWSLAVCTAPLPADELVSSTTITSTGMTPAENGATCDGTALPATVTRAFCALAEPV